MTTTRRATAAFVSALLIVALPAVAWAQSNDAPPPPPPPKGERDVPPPPPKAPAAPERLVVTVGETDSDEESFVIVRDGESGPFRVLGEMEPRAFLGVGMTEISSDLRRHFGAPEDAGVLINRVVDEGPAATAGVKVGDVLSAIDDDVVENTADAQRLIFARRPNDEVVLEIWRDRSLRTLDVTLGETKRRRVDLSKFVFRGKGEGEWVEAMGLADLPKNLESLRIAPIPIDAEEIARIAREAAEMAKAQAASGEELTEAQEKRRADLERRLRELEKKIEALERREREAEAKREKRR